MTASAAIVLAVAMLVLPASPRLRLTRADRDRKITAQRLTGLAVLCFGSASALLLSPATVVAVGVVVVTMSLRERRRRRRRRGADESRELETAIDVLVGELRVGAHPAAAFAVAAGETAGSVADACRAVAARARLGADVAAGLRGVAETSVLHDSWDRVAVCWQLATDHGLAMSALMRAAQRDIAERQRFSSQVNSAMAGARATATIMAGLPLLAVLMGQTIGAHPVAFLLGGHLGGWLLLVGLTLICVGLLWSDRITERAGA